MSSIMNLQRRLNLENERDLALRQLETAKDEDRGDLENVLKAIEKELVACPPVATEVIVERSSSSPALPHSAYSEALPSRRSKSKSSWNEGRPNPKEY